MLDMLGVGLPRLQAEQAVMVGGPVVRRQPQPGADEFMAHDGVRDVRSYSPSLPGTSIRMPHRGAKGKDSSACRHRKPPCPYPVDLLQPRSTPGHAAFAFPFFAGPTSCMKNFLRALRYSW